MAQIFGWISSIIEIYKIGKAVKEGIDNWSDERFFKEMNSLRKDWKNAKTTADRRAILERL